MGPTGRALWANNGHPRLATGLVVHRHTGGVTQTPDWGHPATVFASLAERLYAQTSFEGVYAAISRGAVDLIAGCDHACVSVLAAGGELRCHGATDQVAAEVDRFERETAEGPCLDAIVDRTFQFNNDITRDATWPALTRRVTAQTPVRGMIGYRILVGPRKAGALNVFSDTPGALTPQGADQGAILAAFATVALDAAAKNEQAETLRRGLESNREIGTAVGVLMATHRITQDEAFETLRRASTEMNMKLAEVAHRVIDLG